MSVPSSRMRPEVGRMKPMRRFRTVDLPAPDAPTSAMVSPGRAERVNPSTAGAASS